MSKVKNCMIVLGVAGALVAVGCDDDDNGGVTDAGFDAAPGDDGGPDAADDGGPVADAGDGAVACPDLMPTGSPDFPIISEINPGNYIEVFNPTDSAFTFEAGDQVCQFPAYTPMSSLTEESSVAAGGYVILDWPTGWNEADGEAALYTDITVQTDFGDSTKMRDYVCWGAHSGGRETEAGDAGLWSGDCVANPGDGESLHRIAETDGSTEASYESAAPSMLECAP
ncbi:MAG: hypothetical protein ACOCXM_08980 [Myxococcota bacterium]